jgi:hypothetical protein
MTVAVACAVILTGALKMVDFFAATVRVFRDRDGTVSAGQDRARVSFDWTPVFAWAIAKRRRWKEEGKEGAVRDRLFSLLVDFVFRAPVLASLQAVAILLVAGSTDGHLGLNGTCSFTGGPPDSMWLVVAAATCVSVATMGIVSLLLLMLVVPDGNVEVSAGQYLWRSVPAAGGRRPFGSLVIVPAVTFALFASFAALYLAIFNADPSAFAVLPCHVDAITMVYFSTVIGATVGFGDITASSDAARLAVSFEVICFVTLLSLFLQALRIRGSTGDATAPAEPPAPPP